MEEEEKDVEREKQKLREKAEEISEHGERWRSCYLLFGWLLL